MSGAFFHAPAFAQEWYVGADGARHSELVPTGGNVEIISYVSWDHVVGYFESLGVPRAAWPVYEDAIDLLPSQLEARDRQLREHMRHVRLSADCPGWVRLILDVVHSGEVFFYCIQ
jgi:hypothetical protein